MKIGLASVTFRQKSIEEIVDLAVENNIDYIEWGADVHVKDLNKAAHAKKLCDRAGIKICSLGSYYRVGSNNTEKWIEICKIAKELSAKYIRVWLGDKNSGDVTPAEYSDLLSDAKKVCDIAAEFNLSVSAECHNHTYNNNTDAIIKFINDLNRPNFGTYFQSYYSDRKYDLDRIKRTILFCNFVHVSFRDLKREQRNKQKDNDYLKFIIDELTNINFDGYILIEFTRWNSVNQLKKDLVKLRCR